MSEWQEYRDELNRYILSGESGMMLDADLEWNARYASASADKAAFKLQNGNIVKNFITIWELFDDRVKFRDCIEKLAEKALMIYAKTRFSTIVTATLTGKELAAHVFDKIQRSVADSKIEMVHFGDYPTGAFSQNNTYNFKNKHVLILTDVISSGKLINAMAEVITKHQGSVDAVLSVITTNPALIENQNLENGQLYTFSTGKRALLHNLSDVEIKPLPPIDYDESKVIPIDLHSILPERKNLNQTVYAPAFNVKETFDQLESARAIDYGFFEFDDSRFSCAFIFPRLLKKFRSDIWEKIKEPIIAAAREESESKNDLLLVTTFQQKDSMLKDFIEDRLVENGYKPLTVITLKRGLTDNSYHNLTLGIKESYAKGKTVILTLAALSSHEKLRNIVSLLVQEQVKKIIVVCLLNRMGPYSTNFIKSIERFAKRVRIENSDQTENEDFTQFDFYSIYSFCDLKNNDINNINGEVNWLFSKFRRHTKVEAFDRLCDRMENYFAMNNYSMRAFADENRSENAEPYKLTIFTEDIDHPVEISTISQEAKIALITYNLALRRDFSPIFDEIVTTEKRRVFIHLYGLLLSDIHYLRFTGVLSDLKIKILERIESLRQERFSLEAKAKSRMTADELKRIKTIVNAEVYLIFGLAIIAYHSSLEEWGDIYLLIDELLFCGKTTDEWIADYPISLITFFSDERIFFVLSFLMHGIFPSLHHHKNSALEKIKNKFDQTIENYKQNFKQAFDETSGNIATDFTRKAHSEENLKSISLLIINNFDLLLTETGKHDHLEKHQYIRYLHREVLKPREGHSPIFTSMRTLINSLNNFFEDYHKSDYFKEKITDSILTKVDGALSGTSSLDMISKAVRQMFFFTPTTFEQQARFINLAGQDGFANDTDELKRKLSEIRSDRKCSIEAKKELTNITKRIRDDFLDEESKLRSILREYIVGLDAVLEVTTQEANEQLNKEGFNNLLGRCIEQIKDLRNTVTGNLDKSVYPVLCDKHLLQETIRNLYHNIRYSFPNIEQRQFVSKDLVSVEFEKIFYTPKPEKHEKLGILFRLKVNKGRSPNFEDFRAAQNTISYQLLRIKEYGGEWSLNSNEASGGYTFDLKLMSRFGFFDGSNKEDIKLEVAADEKN